MSHNDQATLKAAHSRKLQDVEVRRRKIGEIQQEAENQLVDVRRQKAASELRLANLRAQEVWTRERVDNVTEQEAALELIQSTLSARKASSPDSLSADPTPEILIEEISWLLSSLHYLSPPHSDSWKALCLLIPAATSLMTRGREVQGLSAYDINADARTESHGGTHSEHWRDTNNSTKADHRTDGNSQMDPEILKQAMTTDTSTTAINWRHTNTDTDAYRGDGQTLTNTGNGEANTRTDIDSDTGEKEGENWRDSEALVHRAIAHAVAQPDEVTYPTLCILIAAFGVIKRSGGLRA